MFPTLFMVLAGSMVMLGLAALWQSLRSAFGGGPAIGSDGAVGLPERTALVAEKQTLLRAIKDIQFERELGKISEEDFERLDKAYRRRAKQVLALLDQDLEPYRVRADKEIADAMGEAEDRGPYRRGGSGRKKKKGTPAKQAARPRGVECPACGVDNAKDAVFCKACAVRIAPLVCAKCGTENDPDAKFCKACAAKLEGGDDDE
ncbi:MAG: zinc ribbon domain-containing protein [Myxococcales bacterium]|nr:zinc ribbon domain-containing protein [Myxococcales bacterium]